MNKKNVDDYLWSIYFELFDKYSKIYGNDNTMIFIQVGSFYETYCLDDRGPDLNNISKILGITKTKKNKNKKTGTDNPYMLGFPVVSLIKFLEILLNNDFIVIIIDQTSEENKEIKQLGCRKMTNIFTKSTYIQNLEKKSGNYLICLYITHDDQPNYGSLYSIGISGIDISTGNVYIHEAYPNKYDESFGLDEAERFMNSLDASEIIIYYQDNTKSGKNNSDKYDHDKEYILNYLKLDTYSCRFYNKIDQKYFKLKFQNELLGKVYTSNKSSISIIEQLNMEKHIYATVSLILGFDFIYDKNNKFLNDLHIPIFFINSKHLTLGNNAVRQLDIIENTNNNIKLKYRSLFNVVNMTSTVVGERFLKSRLLTPLIDSNELNKSYDLIECMMRNKNYSKIEKYLDNIKDIERLQRKIELKIMKPSEIVLLYSSYENILEIISYIKTTIDNDNLNKLLPSPKLINQIKELLNYINDVFDLTELEKYSTLEFKTSIFNDNVYKDIDKIKQNVDNVNDFMEKVRSVLDNLVKQGKSWITIKKNNRDGYYLSLTKQRSEILKEKLNKLKYIIVDSKKIDISLLEFKELGDRCKINIPSLEQSENNIEDYTEQLEKLCKKYYFEELQILYEDYSNLFTKCNTFIAHLDFIKSGAKLALSFSYIKPKIVNNNSSYINVKKLRHPIIERIIDYEYVPHDIELGKDLKGILLYGLNASGKSSCMKAIGCSIILAQSGLYVPAEKFIFTPYTSLYTRITGDDNIFRGLSSFSLEMVEINAILKRADNNTLVIGDEVCRGTENISGNALVATTILKLSELNASFIFATHLHEILKIKEIQKLKTVKPYHLNVIYDDKSKSLIYDRSLKEGSGEQLYGITVAKYIIQDNDFIDKANNIKNELLESYGSIISGKTSKYNSNVYVYECSICGTKDRNCHISNLETHHINFQKDCDENNVILNKKYLTKNHEANLIVLCNECHDKIHNGIIKLDKYVMTSKGKEIIKN